MIAARRPFRVIRKEKPVDGPFKGQLVVTWEADFWEGPLAAGETGSWVRRRFSETAAAARANTGPTVSFYRDLMAAFGRAA